MPQLKTYAWTGLGKHITKSGYEVLFDKNGNFTTDRPALIAELDADCEGNQFLSAAIDPTAALKTSEELIEEAKTKLIDEAQAKVDAAAKELADTFSAIEDAQAIRDANKLSVDHDLLVATANAKALEDSAVTADAIAAKLASLKSKSPK
jgi:hypothetical protein